MNAPVSMRLQALLYKSTRGAQRRFWSTKDFAAAAFLLVSTSLGFVYLFPYDRTILGPFTGVGGLTASLVVLALVTGFLFLREKIAWRTAVGLLLLVVTISVLLWLRVRYVAAIDPLADRDEALAIAWNGLISGSGPYSEPTQLGNPISPMIGGVLLFGPFMFLSLSEFFDLIYPTIFAVLLFRSVGGRGGLAFLLLFSAAPAMKWEIVIQSDGWINAALVAASTLWFGKNLLSTVERSHQNLALLASSAALAISLTYRASYMIILIPLFILAVKIRPTRQTLGWILALIAQIGILLAVTFLIFPTPYGPQHVRGIVQDFEVSPLSLLMILTIAIVLTVALGKLKTLSGVLMWTSIALLSIVLILGISSTSWAELLSSPIESLTSYPPVWLESFGVYPLVASNAGILLLGLLALVWPNQATSSVGDTKSIDR